MREPHTRAKNIGNSNKVRSRQPNTKKHRKPEKQDMKEGVKSFTHLLLKRPSLVLHYSYKNEEPAKHDPYFGVTSCVESWQTDEVMVGGYVSKEETFGDIVVNSWCVVWSAIRRRSTKKKGETQPD